MLRIDADCAESDDMLIPEENTNRIREVYAKFQSDEKLSPAVIQEARIEAALIFTNSVYKEVRAVYDAEDDVDMPCGTIRAWALGKPLFTDLSL